MDVCPKCHYVRQAIDRRVNLDICPACGIVYTKWLAIQSLQNVSHTPNNIGIEAQPEGDITARENFRDFIFYIPEKVDPVVFWSRVFTLIGFVVWSIYFITAGVDWEKIGGSFLHNINLPFHEFGHIFFRPFGRFMTILGGSLFQVMMPLVTMIVFIWKERDSFAGSIMLWWCGQNFIDLAPYIDDAQYRMLPLVGGGGEESHDWGNLLTMMHLLDKTHKIAHASFFIGSVLMLIALVWGFLILCLQKKNILDSLS